MASDLDKPDGLVVVPPGTEQDLLRPMKVTVIPGVGPATAERLRRAGVQTVADLESVSEEELVRLVGRAHGVGLWRLARAMDDRAVEPERETKSVSVEGTYEDDLTDRRLMEGLLTRQAGNVAERLRKHGLSGRTVSIKVRLHDFTTLSRSMTLSSPTDNGAVVARLARTLLADLDTSGGVRLLGVGVSGLADWVQDDLFGVEPEPEPEEVVELPEGPRRTWAPGHGRRARRHGPGLGVGVRQGRGHGPLRDRRHRPRTGAVLPRRRPGAGAAHPRCRVNRTESPGLSWAHRCRSAVSTTADHRVAAGHRMVGQQHHRLRRPAAPAPRRAPCPRWPARRSGAVERGPVSRSPTRLESAETVYVVAHSASSAPGANQSRAGRGAPAVGRSAPGAGCRGRGARRGAARPAARSCRQRGGPTQASVSVAARAEHRRHVDPARDREVRPHARRAGPRPPRPGSAYAAAPKAPAGRRP